MSKSSETMCRCCLGPNATEFIFSKPSKISEKADVSYCDMITACSSFSVSMGDGLPHHICSMCIAQLYHAFKFKEKCDESFRKLKKILLDANTHRKSIISNVNNENIADIKETNTSEKLCYEDGSGIFVNDKVKLEVDMDLLCNGDIQDTQSNANSEDANADLDYSFDTKEFIPKLDDMQPFIRLQSMDVNNQIIDLQPLKITIAKRTRESKRGILKVKEIKICELCGAEFKKKSELKTHCLVEHPDMCIGRFTCNICNQRYSKKTLHNSIHHPELVKKRDPIQCPICHQEFLKKTVFAIHLETHSDDRNYECSECGATFKQYVGLHKHKVLHQGKQFKCDTCLKEFSSKYKLTIHIRSHTKEKPYKCSACPKAYSTGNLRNVHMTNSHPDFGSQGLDKEILEAFLSLKAKKNTIKNVCSYCGKCYNRKSDLQDHINRHLGIKPHSCEFCKKEYYSKRSHLCQLRQRGRRHQCEVCQKTFAHNQHLKTHMYTHSTERPFVCHCGATFKQNAALYLHKKLHEEKAFICHFCSKPFSTKYKLQIHIRIHTNEKPFECDECDLKFITGNQLSTHKLRHGTERSFHCRQCDKNFKTNSDRAQHMRVHELGRRYPCKMCDKKFFRSDHRNRHEATVHALDDSRLNAEAKS